MLRLLVLLVLSSEAGGGSLNLEELTDLLLMGLNAKIRDSNSETIRITEVHEKYPVMDKRWMKVMAEVNCYGGWARNIATLKRTGPVVLNMDGLDMTLDANLGLEILEFGFKQVEVKCKLFKVTEGFEAAVAYNSIVAQISLSRSSGCSVTLNRFALAELGPINVMTGSGGLHRLQDKFFNYLLDRFHDVIKDSVSNAMFKKADAYFKESDLCSKLPF